MRICIILRNRQPSGLREICCCVSAILNVLHSQFKVSRVSSLSSGSDVGQLTGGIAHDFNNLLGAVVGGFDLIRRNPVDPERIRRIAENGLAAAERGAKLTAQLLAFSKSQRLELKPIVVADTVAGMTELLQRTLGPMIRVKQELLSGRSRVLSDPTQLEMAVLNLAINARDAMPDGGELAIRSEFVTVSGDNELADGDYVALSIRDTGTGMAGETVARAFDPFFTTKGVGKGTGLGLSQVYGIAKQAGGVARISSNLNAGTTVTMILPVTQSAEDVQLSASKDEGHSLVRREKILVIDDDTNVRQMTAALLEELGYRVEEASDGEKGIAEFVNSSPDLVLVDFAMPGMNGAEVASKLRKKQSNIPIVFISGYADTAAIERVFGPSSTMLRKPFRMEELSAAIQSALERRN